MNKATYGLIGGGLVAAFIGSGAAYNYGTERQVCFTVSDKERIVETDTDGNTSSKYLVFTDVGTFENTDTLLRMKFRSSDLQGSLQEGESYNATVYGWRIGLMSNYPNIVDAKPAATCE
ncbi:MAG: DUF1523 family protein [Alphaproteobacteria bacterium]